MFVYFKLMYFHSVLINLKNIIISGQLCSVFKKVISLLRGPENSSDFALAVVGRGGYCWGGGGVYDLVAT